MKTTTAVKSLILAGGLALGIGATTIPTSAASMSRARVAIAMARTTSPVHTLSQPRSLRSQGSPLGWICPPPVYMGGAASTTYPLPICPFQGQRHIAMLSRSNIYQFAAGRLLVFAARPDRYAIRAESAVGTPTVRMTAE